MAQYFIADIFALDFGSESLMAIFIAVSSFVFTLYQWLVTMNSKRPRLRMIRFNIKHLYLNDDHKVFNLFPKMNFIIVNLSDLPNSVIKMRIFCKIGRKWQEGKIYSEKEVERTESRAVYDHGSKSHNYQNQVVRMRQEADLFPIMLLPHSSEIVPEHFSAYCKFSDFPSEQDLDKLQLKIELCDQYDKVFRYHFSKKDLQDFEIHRSPNIDRNTHVFGEFRHTDAQGKDVVYRALYVKDKEKPQESKLDIREYHSHRDYSTKSIEAKYLAREVQNAEENRFAIYEGSSVKVYIHHNEGTPQQVELAFAEGDSKTFTLPQEFTELCVSGE